MKKPIKIALIGLLSILAVIVIFYSYRYWQIKTGRIVKVGKVWMTHELFIEQYGDPQNPVAESKNTPEEVYTKFREAILANDVEGALRYVVPEKVGEYSLRLNNFQVLSKYKTLPEFSLLVELNKETFSNFASYEYYVFENGKKNAYSVDLTKSQQGYWLLRVI